MLKNHICILVWGFMAFWGVCYKTQWLVLLSGRCHRQRRCETWL